MEVDQSKQGILGRKLQHVLLYLSKNIDFAILRRSFVGFFLEQEPAKNFSGRQPSCNVRIAPWHQDLNIALR
jgi:hypothetical protein